MTTGIRIKDLPENQRPRERLAELGEDAVSHAELIAILLRTGMKGRSAIEIGTEMVHQYRTLDALSRSSPSTELKSVKGIGRRQGRCLESRLYPGATVMARELAGGYASA